MPSVIDEHQTFIGTDGKPIVNGSIYIGTQNQDPVANTITIYSDRALTTTISNPQTTDSYGRATNKIWVPGKYSIRVDDSSDVQQYQELDAGDVSETGITTLSNIAGTDAITGEGNPAVLTLTDNQQYNFRAANTNTGSVTLQIDLTTAKTIKKQHDVNLVAGDIEANQTVSVIYNSTDDVFELVSNVSASDFAILTVSDRIDLDGGQLSFPATSILSADVNTLDDYEEGTFTVNLNGTETLSISSGNYTKIGRMCWVSARMVVSSIGTGSTSIIYGLPFAALGGASGSFIVGAFAGLTPTDIVNIYLGPGGTQVFNVVQTTTSGNPSSIAIYEDGSDISFSGWYVVDE